jgi:hypothetical protein
LSNQTKRLISQLVENHDGERRKDVIPAEAGIQRKKRKYLPTDWIPASAGMTFYQLNGR